LDSAFEVQEVAVFSDGQRILSAGRSGTLWISDARTHQVLHHFSTVGSTLTMVTVSLDGTRALTGHQDGSIRLLSLETGRVLCTLEAHASAITAVALSSDGRLALTGDIGGVIYLWDLEREIDLQRFSTCEGNRRGHAAQIRGIAFLDGDTMAVTASAFGPVIVWDLETGERMIRLDVTAGPASELPSGSGSSQSRRDPEDEPVINHMALAPDQRTVFIAKRDGSVLIWDAIANSEIGSFTGHRAPVWGVAVSPDGRRAMSHDRDGDVVIWNTETLTEILCFTVPPPRRTNRWPTHWGGIAFLPDGCGMSILLDGRVQVWRLPE
jgi:WD40 repeat protein